MDSSSDSEQSDATPGSNRMYWMVNNSLITCDKDLGGNNSFLPNDKVAELLKRENIQDALTGANVPPTDDLIEYVLNSAARLFLTLALIEKLSALQRLRDEGFEDEDLPVKRFKKKSPDVVSRDKSRKAKCWEAFTKLKPAEVDSFIKAQWRFLAPTFGTDNFDRVFHSLQPLPFMKQSGDRARRRGHFSEVLKVTVHPAHADRELFHKVGADVSGVAVKKFIGTNEYFRRELETLRIIRKLEHDHLVKPIAAFENSDLHCFIFPWAQGGNLRDYWERTDSALQGRLLRQDELVTWTLQQMRGLADCLKLLWDANCRHGDLKPENILLDARGNFVIADVGLSKFHTNVTEVRKQSSSAKFATHRYAAPEIHMKDSHKPLSRDYDIWSMGVVLLEWMTWLVYGDKKLRSYATISTLWVEINGKWIVHPEARAWMAELTRDLIGDTALKRIIEVIESRLLRIELSKEVAAPLLGRANATWLSECMDEIYDRSKREPSYRYDPMIWQRTKGPETTTASLGLPLVHRPRHARLPSWNPRGYNVEMNGTSSVPSINIQTIEGHMPQMSATSVVVPDEYDEIQRRTMKDVWESVQDNTFTYQVFRQVQWDTLRPKSPVAVLCSACRAISIEIWSNKFEHPYDMASLESKTGSCELCGLMYETLLASGAKSDSKGRVMRVGNALKTGDDAAPIMSIYVDPPGAPKEISPPFAQAGLPQLPQPASETQLTILNQWLQTCDHDHKCLSPSQSHDELSMPTRLIDVGTSTAPSIRLIETKTMAYRKYVAFSHCWGDVPKHLKFCTYRDNIEERKRTIDFGRLPQNFKDAVTITRGLGIRYVWIDSICIIQEDGDDWEVEAGNMETVFSAAYCTIAADSAKCSLVGFLRQRKPRPCVTVETKTGRLYFCKAIDDFHHDVEESVLSTRGWVLQERALSRRTIHFSNTQVYFECGQGVRCETLTKLRNPKAEFLEDPHFPQSALKHFRDQRQVLFHDLYSMYSKLTFRYQTDRSVGLLGLERRLARTFGSPAAYGIFSKYLHRSLLWRPETKGELKRIAYKDRRVPSWSWMAYTGAIKYVDAPFNGVEWNTDDLKDPFGSAPLRYSAKISKGQPVAELEAIARRFDAKMFTAFEQEKRCIFDVEPIEDLAPVRCVVLGKNKQEGDQDRTSYALIIKPSLPGQPDGPWERVGVVSLLSFHLSEQPGEPVRIQ